MAMKKEYLSVDGEIFGEVSGGVVNFYDRDALGSVVAIEDGAGNTVSTIEYKPFGDVRTYTGENPLSSPRRFLWCGTHGYRFNERYAQYTSHYVRARHYSSLQGMWSTVDPLYPRERAYAYVGNRVTVGIDPSGRDAIASGSVFRDVYVSKNLFEWVRQGDCDSNGTLLECVATFSCISCVGDQAKIAKQWNDKTYKNGKNNFNNSDMNALRHCLWSCLTLRACGCNCAKTNDLKEAKDLIEHGQDLSAGHPGVDSKCDLINNRVGRLLGESSSASCVDSCISMLNRGMLCLLLPKKN